MTMQCLENGEWELETLITKSEGYAVIYQICRGCMQYTVCLTLWSHYTL